MNTGVDILGIQGVATCIRQSGMPKFFITHFNSGKGSTPVFESLNTNSAETAAKKFIDWGNNLLAGNPNNDIKYEIVVHNQDDNTDDDEAPKRARKNRMRYSFMLTPGINGSQVLNGSPQPIIQQPVIDQSKYIPVEDFEKKVKEAVMMEKLLNKVDNLEKRLEEGDDHQEREPSWIGFANKAIDRLWPLPPVMQLNQPGTQPGAQAINGVDALPDEELDKIDDAIDKILKVDPNFVANLTKLSLLAEKQPQYFMQLIGMLNNMQV